MQVQCSIPSVLLGSSHNIIYTPVLVRNFAQLRSSVVDNMSIKRMLFNRTFRNLAEYQDIYTAASDELDICVAKHILQDPYMSDMSRSAISRTHAHLKSLVALKEMPKGKENDGVDLDPKSDFEPWQRHASVKRIEN